MTESETEREDDAMIEELAGAYRPRDPRELRYHPVFHDLGEDARARAFERALVSRRLEAALDADGYSSTVHAVLARIAEAAGS